MDTKAQAAAGLDGCDLPPVATPEDVARFLQVSTKTIYRMAGDGRLRGTRTHVGRGGKLRFKRADVLALVEVSA